MTREKCFDCRAWYLILPGILLGLACLAEARGAPPPSDYTRAGLADAGPVDASVQETPPGDGEDGLGTSPSLADIGEVLGAIYLLAHLVVGLTPTKKDDAALARVHAFVERWVVVTPGAFRGAFKLPGKRVRPNGEGV